MRPRYRIVRFFQNPDEPSVTIRAGLTLDEAKAHCNNPETSSSTAKSRPARRITSEFGPWFDGYEQY